MRERAHVAGALHVVLAAQRIHADAFAADVSGRHGEIGDRHDRGRALAVLGDAEPVIDRAIAAGGVETRGRAQLARIDAARLRRRLGRMTRIGDEARPGLEIGEIAAFADERLVDEALGDDDMRQGVEDGDIGSGLQGEMIVGLDVRLLTRSMRRGSMTMRRAPARRRFFMRDAKNRMRVGRIGADDDHDIRLVDRLEILRARRGAEGLRQAEAGRRVADARAGVDVVVAEAGANHLLDQEHFLVGAARGADRADRVAPVLRLDAPEFVRRISDRVVPGDFAPRILDPLADHRLENAVLVGGVAIGEPALDAGMALVGLAGLVGDHAQDFVALELRLERAADAAIGAGGHDRALRRSLFDDQLFVERRGRAGLHAGAAGHAFRRQEIDAARSNLRVEAAAENGQRECALHLLAGAHAARADDAFRGFEGEIGIGGVGRRLQMVRAVIAVAHVAQADVAGLGLQLAIVVGAAGQAIQRMVGNVELHDAAAQALQARRLGADDHPRFGRRRAGGGRALAALDFDQAEAARAERLDAVRRAEFGDRIVDQRGGGHHRRPRRHADLAPVDGQRDRRLAGADRRARVEFLQQRHGCLLFRRDARGRLGEILAEMIERAQHRHGREAAERAERAVGHDLAKIAQQLDVLLAVAGRR